MSTYNTKLYSPTAFKRAIIFENQRINHLGVDLNQIHQILLDEDTSTLDANIHYSQVYDEESLKKPSFLKFSESSPFYDVNEFDEEIKINECNLKPQAHTLFYENPEKVIAQENLNVPEIERVLRTKTFHDNSIEEESIGTATSPCFETLRIGTIGKSDQILEQKIDINAQISQIRMNSILKNASLDHPGGINYINNHYLPENISDRIEMTNRSSYRSLSQLEQFSKHTEISKTNIANFSDFLNVKEKNSGTGTMKSNISEEENNDIYSKVTYYLQENEKKDQILVHKNILHGDTINIKHTLNNNEVFTPQKHQKENSFGFNDLEEKLKIINETIHSKNLENNEKMILQKRNKEEVLIESKNIDEELKKITEIHEKTNQKSFSNKIEFVNIENNEITSQSEQYEINENPIVFSNSDNKILTNFDNNTTKTMQKITENELIEKESDEKKFKNLTFFLNLEKKIKEDANKLRNDQILKNTTKSENSTTFNPSHLNIKNQKEEENKKYETNEKNMQVSETNKNFTTNVNVQNYSNNTKENINRDNKSIHMSKIADSFKDIAATITETINKHKIQIEKDCDLSIFKNFLHKVREQSNERISRKYAIAENSINYEPNEKKPSNNNKEMPEFYHCINSNIQSVQRENPKYISDKIDQSNLPFEIVTPNKPEHFIFGMTPSNHFNPNASSTQMKYQSPIPLEIENYSNSQFLIGSKNRNPTSIKTCKNIVSNSQNSSEMQPYFKFRSKSCEKHKKEEKLRENSFESFVKMQNWHLNNYQKKNTQNFLRRVDQDLKKRKIQNFKNEIKKKNRCIEEIKNIEEINNCKGKLTKDASQNLIKKLMQDAQRRNFEKEKKIREKKEKEIKSALQMANTKLINPKSEVLSVFKKTPLVQIVDSEKRNFKKKTESNFSIQSSFQHTRISKENTQSIKKNSSTKKIIQESSQKRIKTNILKENNNQMNIENVNIDPFQDFLTNYNKKFIEENSETAQNITDSQTQIDGYSKIEDQHEIIGINEEEDKIKMNSFSSRSNSKVYNY